MPLFSETNSPVNKYAAQNTHSQNTATSGTSEAGQLEDHGTSSTGEKRTVKTLLPGDESLASPGTSGIHRPPVSPVSELIIEKAALPAESRAWTQVEKANVISQLVEKAHLLAAGKNTELVINLKPEFLGRLCVHASMDNNILVATITVDSPAVKSLLESHLPILHQSLQEQGLSASKITVVQGSELTFGQLNSGDSRQHQGLESQQPSRLPFNDSLRSPEPESQERELSLSPLLPSNRVLNLIA